MAATGSRAWRIAKTSYGPMNPPLRELDGSPESWGRYDVAGHRTIYCGAPREAAYGESIAQFRPAIEVPLTDLFDNDPSDTRSLAQVVAEEWADRQHMPQGKLAAGWRQERLIHEVTLPRQGWFVDMERARSTTAVAAVMPQELLDRDVEQLTIGYLRSEDRILTTGIAGWIHAQVLDDGSLPHGIYFGSKHDRKWDCWAIWLRAIDDGHPAHSEPTTCREGQIIGKPSVNRPLDCVARDFNIHCH
nr:RES domain-containing protein [Rhodococcus jostii]